MTIEEYLLKRIEELEDLVKYLQAELDGERTSRHIYFVFDETCPGCEYKVNYKDRVITVEKINDDK